MILLYTSVCAPRKYCVYSIKYLWQPQECGVVMLTMHELVYTARYSYMGSYGVQPPHTPWVVYNWQVFSQRNVWNLLNNVLCFLNKQKGHVIFKVQFLQITKVVNESLTCTCTVHCICCQGIQRMTVFNSYVHHSFTLQYYRHALSI